MTERESAIEQYLESTVAKLGGVALKVTVPGQRGWQDRFCYLPAGVHFLVELKRPKGGVVAELQKVRRRTMEGLGQFTMYAWMIDPKGGRVLPQTALTGVRRGKKSWSQDEGLALFLVLNNLAKAEKWANLMFGTPFALWVMAVVSLMAWLGGSDWLGWGPDFVACGLLPVLVSHAVWRFEQALPANPVLYVLVNGFAGGGLALLASHMLKAAAGLWLGVGEPAVYLTAGMLMMFGEGFLCGGAMALVVVYRPQWCASFDDRRYLQPPR